VQIDYLHILRVAVVRGLAPCQVRAHREGGVLHRGFFQGDLKLGRGFLVRGGDQGLTGAQGQAHLGFALILAARNADPASYLGERGSLIQWVDRKCCLGVIVHHQNNASFEPRGPTLMLARSTRSVVIAGARK